MRFAYCLALILLTACAPELHAPNCYQWIDPRFTDEERTQIETAIRVWNEALFPEAAIHIVDEHPGAHPIFYMAANDSRTTNKSGWTYGLLGKAIYLVPEYSDVWLGLVTAHEIGHHWGLAHDSHSKLMANPPEWPDTTVCVDSAALAQWCGLYDCQYPHYATCDVH